MKVLLINGSPHAHGNTALALAQLQKTFTENGVETEIIQVGSKPVRGCIACGSCYVSGRCVTDDIVNETAPKLEAADGIVVASPVYYGSANGTLMAALQRLFYSSHFDKSLKVGASVVSARRSGCTATFDELNKFFTLSNMPIATSQYWNNIYGWEPGEARVDDEGRQVMRVLARNMIFLMQSIALGRDQLPPIAQEPRVWTNFTR